MSDLNNRRHPLSGTTGNDTNKRVRYADVVANGTTIAPSALSMPSGMNNLILPTVLAPNVASSTSGPTTGLPPPEVAASTRRAPITRSAAAAMLSPYASTYHHSTAAPSPVTPATTAINTMTTRSGLRLGTLSFEQISLKMPANLAPNELATLRGKLVRELNHQVAHPPALPRSKVEPLPPKPLVHGYLDPPESATPEQLQAILVHNNVLSEENAATDRARNNKAAKKSRETRIESLDNTRDMLNAKSAECAWMRLKLIQLGGDPADWDNMAKPYKDKMVDIVHARVKASNQKIAEEKKKEESRRRSERNKERAALREASMRAAAIMAQIPGSNELYPEPSPANQKDEDEAPAEEEFYF